MKPKQHNILDYIDGIFPEEQVRQINTAFDLLNRGGSKMLSQYLENRVMAEANVRAEFLSQFPFAECPAPEQRGLVLGSWSMCQDVLVRLDTNSLAGSMLFCGATGSGKTNSLMWLLRQIRDSYFDTYSRFIVVAPKSYAEQRILMLDAKPESVYFLTQSNFALNPLNEFHNYKRNLAIADTARCLATELGIYEAGQLYLQSSLTAFIEKYANGNLFQFVEWLKNRKEKSRDYSGYRDRLLVRLLPMMDEVGQLYDYDIGLSEELITNNLVIELPCSSTFITSSVSALIMMRMYRIKSMHPEFQKYKTILVFEDIYDTISRSESRK